MIELLALPAWNAPPRTLDDWSAQLSGQGHRPTVVRDGSETWIEVAPLRLRGYVELEGGRASAINFELSDPDPGPASQAVREAATALGWEVHAEDDEDEDEDD